MDEVRERYATDAPRRVGADEPQLLVVEAAAFRDAAQQRDVVGLQVRAYVGDERRIRNRGIRRDRSADRVHSLLDQLALARAKGFHEAGDRIGDLCPR